MNLFIILFKLKYLLFLFLHFFILRKEKFGCFFLLYAYFKMTKKKKIVKYPIPSKHFEILLYEFNIICNEIHIRFSFKFGEFLFKLAVYFLYKEYNPWLVTAGGRGHFKLVTWLTECYCLAGPRSYRQVVRKERFNAFLYLLYLIIFKIQRILFSDKKKILCCEAF